jgi:hypothetical protein
MEPTKFPIETDAPTVGVALPTGVHVIKLTVTDDAGMVSAPDRVVITVRPIPTPDAVTIVPTSGTQGSVVNAVVYGKHLDTVTAITIFAGSQPDDRMSVEIRPGGTEERLPIRLTIADDAVPGQRTIEISSAVGIDSVYFEVQPNVVPEVNRVRPEQGFIGNEQAHNVTLMGANLDRASGVEFLLRDRVDDQVIATIERSSNESIALGVRVSSNAEFGRRRLRVTTRRGVGQTAAAVGYRIVPGYLQIAIMIVTALVAVLHFVLPLPPIGIVYLLLLAGMYLPVPELSTMRPWFRLALALFAILNLLLFVLAKVAPASFPALVTASPVAYLVAVLELLLVVLLLVESRSPRWKETLRASDAAE